MLNAEIDPYFEAFLKAKLINIETFRPNWSEPCRKYIIDGFNALKPLLKKSDSDSTPSLPNERMLASKLVDIVDVDIRGNSMLAIYV